MTSVCCACCRPNRLGARAFDCGRHAAAGVADAQCRRFLRNQGDEAGYAVGDLQGNVVAGDAWISFDVPATGTAEFIARSMTG